MKEEETGQRYLWGTGGKPWSNLCSLSINTSLTGCVSTQVGCPVGCAFAHLATGG